MRTVRFLSRFGTLSLLVLVLAAGIAQAAPLTLYFQFSGANYGVPNGATATGFITFEDTLLPNPGDNHFDLPNAAVLDLQVTVAGAAAGNGTYGLSDFNHVNFSNIGVPLDFTSELVGQFSGSAVWGVNTGDFNLFYAAGTPTAPNGNDPFLLCANGGAGDCMELVTMNAAGVPATGPWGLAALAALLLACGGLLLRRRGVTPNAC